MQTVDYGQKKKNVQVYHAKLLVVLGLNITLVLIPSQRRSGECFGHRLDQVLGGCGHQKGNLPSDKSSVPYTRLDFGQHFLGYVWKGSNVRCGWN